jgi:hypothetical protein
MAKNILLCVQINQLTSKTVWNFEMHQIAMSTEQTNGLLQLEEVSTS